MYPRSLPTTLLKQALKNISSLTHPVVRISGPLTTGGAGYEKNLERFKTAEVVLKRQGYSVFNTSHDDEQMHEAGVLWETIMAEYHTPLLLSGQIDEVFFLPNWKESHGATRERTLIEEQTRVTIKDFPSEWFSQK